MIGHYFMAIAEINVNPELITNFQLKAEVVSVGFAVYGKFLAM